MVITVKPVVPEVWGDLEKLFGPNGACSGCWCMWWRITSAEFARDAGEANRRAFRALVRAGQVPGLIAYDDGDPVGWVSVAPRSEFGRIERSPKLRPIDDAPVWSIVCFYIDRRYRGRKIAPKLLDEAVRWAGRNGARVVEAYPVAPGKPAASSFTGVEPMFARAGFREVARRGGRAIVRKTIRPARATTSRRTR